MPELALEETLFGIARSGDPRVVVFGAPLDATAGCRDGGGDGPTAVREASRTLESYSRALERDLIDVAVTDEGDLDLPDDAARAAGRIEVAVAAVADAGRLPVLVGGEHTVSIGAVRALLRVHPDLILLHVDAHADLRAEHEGETVSRATWIVHSGIALGQVVQAGIRSIGAEERTAMRQTAHTSAGLVVPRDVVGSRPVYVSLDIDVLDPSAAPGVRCPEPAGVSAGELLAFVRSLGDLNVVGFDVVEIAPDTDPAGLTALAAAKLLRELILVFA
jgi:agmatinase